MPQSLVKNYIHIVFSTKSREPLISEDIEKPLHTYIIGISEKLDCPIVNIGGYYDHVHILCDLSKKVALATLVEKIKVQSSKWIKTNGSKYSGFYWQRGYGAFSVRASAINPVIRYIDRQHIHHKNKTFMDEYRDMLISGKVSFDERYIWD